MVIKNLIYLLFLLLLINLGLFGSDKFSTKCKKCGTVLPDIERLKKHQEKAHNKKKEKCRVCGGEFDYSEDLRRHKKDCR